METPTLIKAYKNQAKEMVRLYNYDGHNLIRCYDKNKDLIDVISVSNWDDELNYQKTGQPYPDEKVLDRIDEHWNTHRPSKEEMKQENQTN